MTPDQYIDLRDRLIRVETLITAKPDLEPRVRKVEQRQFYLAGGGSMLGALVALFVKGHVA